MFIQLYFELVFFFHYLFFHLDFKFSAIFYEYELNEECQNLLCRLAHEHINEKCYTLEIEFKFMNRDHSNFILIVLHFGYRKLLLIIASGFSWHSNKDKIIAHADIRQSVILLKAEHKHLHLTFLLMK